MKKLYRSRTNSVLGGVCGGIGNYLNVDPAVVRILFVIGFFTVGFGILAYIVALFIMPLEPLGDTYDYNNYNEHGDHGSYNEYSPSSSHTSMHSTRLIIGLALIAIGAMTVFQRLFGWFNFNFFWPIILIIVGLVVLLQGFRRS